MTKQRIVIVGAGIGGSALGAILRKRNLSVTILDKNSKPPRNTYGLTLERSTFLPLLSSLGLDEDHFVAKTRHPLIDHKGEQNTLPRTSSLRVTRASLEDLLRQDLDVQWSSTVASIDNSTSPINVVLGDGREIPAEILVAADGVHSTVRKSLLPAQSLEVLPFAVFNGRTNLSIEEAQSLAAASSIKESSQDANVRLVGRSRLTYSIYKYGADKATIDFTFSRPAEFRNDRLHKPDRPNSGARDIPVELYNELDQLRPLDGAFAQVFDPSAVRDARLLHWLMRRCLIDRSSLDRLAASGTIFIGDAAHTQPILGGNGANGVLLDAVRLAALLDSDFKSVANQFYDARYKHWEIAANNSRDALQKMHSPPSSAL